MGWEDLFVRFSSIYGYLNIKYDSMFMKFRTL